MNIGEKIFQLRKSKNLSQEELASVLNVSRQTISKWETGESSPDFDKIVPLCDYFEITTDELLKGNSSVQKEIVVNKKTQKYLAITISSCIILFTIMCIAISFLEAYNIKEEITASVSLVCLSLISIIIVCYFCIRPRNIIKKEKIKEKNKAINSIISILTVIIYLIVSFVFQVWAYSWIIFLIGALVEKIIGFVLLLGEDNHE